MGCVYKVISKVLSKRMKVILEGIIDERQCAFVGGRNMLDGVLIANEVVDDAKRRKNGCLFFKMDFRKAYDSVRREFLYYIMRRWRFLRHGYLGSKGGWS